MPLYCLGNLKKHNKPRYLTLGKFWVNVFFEIMKANSCVDSILYINSWCNHIFPVWFYHMLGNLNMYNFSLAKVNNQLSFVLLNYLRCFIYLWRTGHLLNDHQMIEPIIQVIRYVHFCQVSSWWIMHFWVR